MLAGAGCGGSARLTDPGGREITFGADVPVRITTAAVRPELLHLFEGLEVTFVNEDAVPRTIAVDAARSDQAGCAAIGTGPLQPGETRKTPALPRFTTCAFRDAQRPGEAAFQGVVVTH